MENAYKRKKEPELNKQLILEAATDIGAAEDWHQVTFQAIADKTGLSKGGIIHHFKNKEELLDELLRQSLSELTQWINDYRQKNKETNGAMAYLQAVVSRKKDEKYTKTMRIILQAIMVNEQYRQMWYEWHKEHIAPPDGNDLDTKSLITYLVADAIWYMENTGFSIPDDRTKKRIVDYLKS
ncbi:TetR/AcrR family transcriptional regulator [Chitinophagaceae bacterium LWZ2-11]